MKESMEAPSLGKGKGVLALAIEDEGDERESFEAFADTAGIPEAKRDAAYDALVAMIQACIARDKGGEYDDEEG